MELEQNLSPITLVDTHVHIYDCFDIDRLLDSAWNNFSISAQKYQSTPNFTGVLLLTETRDDNWFASVSAALEQHSDRQSVSTRWHFSPTEEPYSIRASSSPEKKLYLMAGRQVVTEEKLEVLALMTDRHFPDGRALEATIEEIQNAGGLVVLPWGVGKWLGKRGQFIDRLLQTDRLSPVFLGDNSGRPQFWWRPSYFQAAEQKGGRILPGTDPLPLASEASRPGSFGLVLSGAIDSSEPGEQLKSMLLNPEVSGQAYGTLETPWRFIRNQVALRIQSQQNPSAATIEQKDNPMATGNHFPETADIETSSEDYATRFAGDIGAWLLKVQEEATLRMLEPYPQAKILDVGGGHGQLTGALIERGYQVTVLGSAEVCKARIQPYLDRRECAFQVGNVLDMPYPDGAFDVVISYRFLAHVSQWQQFLKELARVASQAVIVDYPTVRSANAIAPYLFKFKKGLEGNTRPFICYQERDILDFYQSIGLQKDSRCGQFFFPMVLHRALKKEKISSALETTSQVLGLNHLFGSPVIAKFCKT